MHVYIWCFAMHITVENTVKSYACVHLVVFNAFFWWNTVYSYACVH